MDTGINEKERLVKARDAWDAENTERVKVYEAQCAEFERKKNEIFDGIKGRVAAALAEINLNLEIKVGTWHPRGDLVRLTVMPEGRGARAEDNALDWFWESGVGEDGSVEKASGSSSGLRATTPGQVESLKQTARALEILNGLDWETVLAVGLPKWRDYVTEQPSVGKRPDFEAAIRAAEITGLIGTDTLVKGGPTNRKAWEYSWYLIVGETPKQFKVAELAGHTVQEGHLAETGMTLAQVVERAKGRVTCVSKEKFVNDILHMGVETMAF